MCPWRSAERGRSRERGRERERGRRGARAGLAGAGSAGGAKPPGPPPPLHWSRALPICRRRSGTLPVCEPPPAPGAAPRPLPAAPRSPPRGARSPPGCTGHSGGSGRPAPPGALGLGSLPTGCTGTRFSQEHGVLCPGRRDPPPQCPPGAAPTALANPSCPTPRIPEESRQAGPVCDSVSLAPGRSIYLGFIFVVVYLMRNA